MEVVRAAYDAFERGDLEAVSQLQAPSIEWQTSVEDPDAATHRGRVAVRRYIEGYMETFPGLRADLEECVEAPGDRVLATVRYTGRQGRAVWTWTGGSGSSTHSGTGSLFDAAEYFDRDQALEAAGLSE